MSELDKRAVWPGWETVRLIGRGSFGAVYEITREFYGEKESAALKVIRIPPTDGEIDDLRADGLDDDSIRNSVTERVQNMVKEYSLMRKLSGNTNVVNCDDVMVQVDEDGLAKTILIKMELLTPMNKATLTGTPEELALRVGIAICNALELCEARNIIHRDIKPANIFLSQDGAFKLGDFGVSRTMERTVGATRTGTDDYMAPEVYLGHKYNHNVDIYSLGIVLYWLLNNRRMPFLPQPPAIPTMNERAMAIERRCSDATVPAPVNGSSGLQRIVLKACAYNPTARYQSAAEMRSDLIALTGNQGVMQFNASQTAESGGTGNTDAGNNHSINSALPDDNDDAGATVGAREPRKPAEKPDTTDINENGTYTNKEQTGLDSSVAVPKCSSTTIEPDYDGETVGVISLNHNRGQAKNEAHNGVAQKNSGSAVNPACATNQPASDKAESDYDGETVGIFSRNRSYVNGQSNVRPAENTNKSGNATQSHSAGQQTPSSSKSFYQRGMEAYNRKDYSMAFKCFEFAAKHMDIAAQNEVGTMLEDGLGTEANPIAAFQAYKISAEGGNCNGQYNLARCYRHGKGTERNYKLAFYWYQRGAEQGHAPSQRELGTMYRMGFGVDMNKERALDWYSKAARQGDAAAKEELASWNAGRAIAIDLGAANARVAVMVGNKPVLIPDTSESNGATPSTVVFTRMGERLVGHNAKQQAVANPGRTVSHINLEMGTGYKVKIDKIEYSPQQISAMILQKLKTDAEGYLRTPVTDAVITVPAYFNEVQRNAVREAGKIAGLEIKRVICSPAAAAMYYYFKLLDKGVAERILICDLGGGSFNAAVAEISNGAVKILSTAGNNHLGGVDFDLIVAEYLCAEFKREYKIDLHRDPVAMQRVTEAAEQAKIRLSSAQSTAVNIPNISTTWGKSVHLNVILTREKFNELTLGLTKSILMTVGQTMESGKSAWSSISGVLLVGGASRIPVVREAIRNFTGKEPINGINPDIAVVNGACVQVGKLTGAIDNVLLTDVLPLSIGVENGEGKFSRIIESNTSIPTKKSKIFKTRNRTQTSIEIRILQGENDAAGQNTEIGLLRVTDIPWQSRGQAQIEITCDLDANGSLNFSAKHLDTGKPLNASFIPASSMSRTELNQAIQDAQLYATMRAYRDKLRTN